MTWTWSIAITFFISFILAGLPVMISIVQKSSVEKQKKIICSLNNLPVSKTEYYRLAMYYITNIEPASLNASYRVPILFFSSVILFLSSMALFGASASSYFSTYSVILSAMHGLEKVDVTYQKGTFAVGVWAFIGAYVYLLYRLISRINNNDVYPITFYYYTNRLIIACLVAGVARHSLTILFPSTVMSTELLTLLGFAIGWRPDLWISTMYYKITARLKIFSGQAEPDPKLFPVRLSIDLLQGMSNDDRERLEELDIKDCHDLANQNPFIIFARTSYPLLHVVDWMAQAQLAVIVGETCLHKYRTKNMIRDVFILDNMIQTGDVKELAKTLEISEDNVSSLRWYLKTCPCIGRLRDVRRRLSEQVECREGSWQFTDDTSFLETPTPETAK